MNSGNKPRSSLDKMRYWALLGLHLIPVAVAAQGIADIRFVTPRDFGYTIGDTFIHEMHLTLNEPITLDTTTLPDNGRLNRWLEISGTKVEVRAADQSASYRIIVEYQVFNAPQELTSVTVPQLEFMTMGGPNRIPVFLPEWTFSIGPITDLHARQTLQLQEDRPPQTIPVTGRRIRLVIWALLLGGLLIYLAYRRFLLPRLKRNRYPFSSALRELRDLHRQRSDPENYRRGLKTFHAAMNATAGQVVFAGNLDNFLLANSRYGELEPELRGLYARSQDVFFNDAGETETDSAWQQLVDICRRCREFERSVA